MERTSTPIPSEFRAWLEQLQPLIEDGLSRAVSVAHFPQVPQPLRKAMEYALCSGGKRVRPALCLLAAEACGGAREDALPAALACEMVHAYSLIHDDLPCMDDDVLRRGRPTTHVQFGEATAVLAGDALQALAFQTLAAQKDAEVVAKQVAFMAAAIGPAGMVGGQQTDMESEGCHPALEEVLAIHSAKTGALITASLMLGAVAAHRNPQPWQDYGQAIGRLFQMSDDILDATASTAELGKTAGKDEAAEKATIVGVLGLAAAQELVASEVERALAAVQSLAAGPFTSVLSDLPRFLGARRS